MRISIIGTGYVGLVSGVCFAEIGHQVTCVDLRAEVADRINAGVATIHEAGLDPLLKKHSGSRLKATTDLQAAVRNSAVSFIAVGTPFDGVNIDLAQIKAAAQAIGEALRDKTGFHLVVVKSTVVPGTTRDVVLPIIEQASGRRAGVNFGIAMNPEFLREGEAINDFMQPDRIVLGTEDPHSLRLLEQVYAPFSEQNVPLIRTNTKTAEMIKYTSNALFATLISFSNEIGNLCSTFGDMDVVDVLRGVHADRRLSPRDGQGNPVRPGMLTYLAAGCGFGGSCFPKDVKALAAQGRLSGYVPRILESVLEVNQKQPCRLIDLLHRHFPSVLHIKIAVLGVAFKPGTDDVRESPALLVIQTLTQLGAEVRVYDPVVRLHEANLPRQVQVSEDLAAAVNGVDAVVVITPWPEFAALETLIAGQACPPVLIDGRRAYARERYARYEGVGL